MRTYEEFRISPSHSDVALRNIDVVNLKLKLMGVWDNVF